MKIVVYSKPFFPQMGGLERNTLTLCSALVDLGHEVTLITETKSESKEEYAFRVVRTRSLRGLCRQLTGADLVITNGGNVPLWGVVPATLQGLPYGIIYHGFRGFGNDGDGVWGRLKNSFRQSLARKAQFNVFTSTQSKEITDVPKEAAYVLLNPVDKQLASLYQDDLREPKASGPFLFAGRLIRGKGIFTLAEALRRLDGDHDIELIVAGEGRDADRFRSRVRDLETIEVTMAGRLDDAELVPLYERAKALIVPTTTHVEGNPLVIAEALYAGTPVVASDQPPMIESVGEAGIVIEQGNAKALAAAIRRLEDDESYYQFLRSAAKARSGTFGYERYREELKSILHSTG